MAISLQNLVRKDRPKTPIMCIYGTGGMGKTTLASEFPDAIFIQTEDGANGLGVMSFSEGPLTKYADVEAAITELATEDHAFKTVVLDSVTRLEPMIWAEVCARNNWKSIEEPGYGKGYTEADSLWSEFLSGLQWLRDNKNMAIIILGHESVQSFQDPTGDSYDRYTMRLHKRAEALVREQCDVMGFLNQITTIDREKKAFGKKDEYVAKAKGSGQRALNLSPRPAFMAKQRSGYNFPDKVLINAGQGYAVLAQYLPEYPETKTKQAAA